MTAAAARGARYFIARPSQAGGRFPAESPPPLQARRRETAIKLVVIILIELGVTGHLEDGDFLRFEVK